MEMEGSLPAEAMAHLTKPQQRGQIPSWNKRGRLEYFWRSGQQTKPMPRRLRLEIKGARLEYSDASR